jgi:hypothetical protein
MDHGTKVRAIVLGMQVAVVLMRTPSLAYVFVTGQILEAAMICARPNCPHLRPQIDR